MVTIMPGVLVVIVLAAKTKAPVLSPEVLIAFIGIFGTLAAAVISSVLTHRAALRRETLQWQRTVREQRRQEALNACEEFATLTTTIAISGQLDREGILRGLNRVELHTSESIAQAANELRDLLDTTLDLREQIIGAAVRENRDVHDDEDQALQAATVAFNDKRNQFLKLAREEYDHPEVT